MPTLYDRLGGFAALTSVVSRFYELVVGDPDLRPWFDRVDVERLTNHQVQFLCGIMGGPRVYSGESLSRIHASLGITHAAFDKVAGMLHQSMTEHGIAPGDVAQVLAVVASVRGQIVVDQDGRPLPPEPSAP